MAEKIDYDKTHRQNLSVVAVHIDKIFKEAAQEAAKIGVSLHKTLPDGKIFSFADYPETKKQIDRLIEDLKQNLTTITVNGIRSAWTLSNNKNNALSRRIFGDNVGKLSQIQYRRYFTNNAQALDAFIARKTNGLNLSDRVWKYTDEFKHEIELGLDIGIRNGLSASKMARDLQQYLQFPDKLFRRIRDEHGSLQLSKAAKAFHPGQGVYRSSYKNARRLAVTETNMAYRTADHLRWQSMDFVIGVEVKLSGNHTCLGRDGKPHPFYDICDELKGTYPKGFKFTGWHPQCRCYAVPKLADQDEFMEHVRNMGTDGGDESYSGEVTDVPDNFKEWVKGNGDRIIRAEQRGTTPYFIKDNKDRVNQILDGGKIRDDQTTLVTVRIDANRRLYEQLKANPNYIGVKFNPQNGGLKATHNGHNFNDAKGWYEKAVQEAGYLYGHSVVLEEEVHTIKNKRNVEGLFDGLPFEIAGAETGIPNNIRNALKHCASKPECRIAVIFLPDESKVNMSSIRTGLKKYFGLRRNQKQFKDFDHIYFMSPKHIIYHQKKQGD